MTLNQNWCKYLQGFCHECELMHGRTATNGQLLAIQSGLEAVKLYFCTCGFLSHSLGKNFVMSTLNVYCCL